MRILVEVTQVDWEIDLQFNFTNEEAIPQFMEDLPEETMDQAISREELNEKGMGVDLAGDQFRGKMVDLRGLTAGFLQTDYVLVGAWKQEMIQTKQGFMHGKPYWMIRFRFRHKDHLAEYRATMDETAWQEMEANRPALLGELVYICSLAFWQVRAWRNPYYQDNNILHGVYAISLNFAGRKPLYEWDPPKSMGDEDLPPQHKPEFVLTLG